MSWREQDWSESYNALEEAVRSIRKAELTMLDRRLSYDTKVDRITADLHRMRRAMDDCCAAMEWTEADVLDSAVSRIRSAA